MNRKEGLVVAVLLLTTFTVSAFAAPAIQNIMILNDPLNVRIVGGTKSLRTTSVDIEVLNVGTGVTATQAGQGTNGVQVYTDSQIRTTLKAAFSFAPSGEFVETTSVLATIIYVNAIQHEGDVVTVRLNGQSPASTTYFGSPGTMVASLSAQHLGVGSNMVEIGLEILPSSLQSYFYVYQVWLTVEYTFMA